MAGPNTEADGKSDFNNVRVGGAQHRNFLKNFNRQWKLGTGPNIKLTENQISIMWKLAGHQHREFRKEIQQAMRVGDGAQT